MPRMEDSAESLKQMSLIYSERKPWLDELQRRYPNAYLRLEAFAKPALFFPLSFIEFSRIFGLDISTRLILQSTNKAYVGTYTYIIHFTEAAMQALGRKSRWHRYPGINTQSSAYEKLIDKSMEFIECLLTEVQRPQKKRTYKD